MEYISGSWFLDVLMRAVQTNFSPDPTSNAGDQSQYWLSITRTKEPLLKIVALHFIENHIN